MHYDLDTAMKRIGIDAATLATVTGRHRNTIYKMKSTGRVPVDVLSMLFVLGRMHRDQRILTLRELVAMLKVPPHSERAPSRTHQTPGP